MKIASRSRAQSRLGGPSWNWRLLWLLAAAFGVLPQTLWAQGAPDIVWQTNGHNNAVTAIAIAPDGASVASGSLEDGFYGYVRVWRVQDTALMKAFSLSHEDVFALAFSPDGNFLAEGGGGGEDDESTLRVWRTTDWERIIFSDGAPNDFVTSLSFSRDSEWLGLVTSAGNRLILRNVDDSIGGGGGSDDGPPGGGTVIAFSPNADTLVTGGQDGSVTLWDYTNGLSDQTILRTYPGQSASVSAVAFLPNGAELASASYDSTVLIRRLADGAITRTFRDSNAVVSMAVSPDGKTLLTASADLKFWRISDGKLLQAFDQETQGVTSLAVTKDGKRFAYGRSDGAVVLARLPVWIESITQSGGKITLHWQGGSGRYRVQARPHLDNGEWHNHGPITTNTTFTHSAHSRLFYRVVGLPNP